MKICYLCADLGISLARHNGASAHFRSLVRAFKELGHEVLVITASAEGTEELGTPVVPIRRPDIFEPLLSEIGQRKEAESKAGDPSRRRVVRALGHIWNNLAVEQVLGAVLPQYRPDLLFEVYSPFGVAGGIIGRRMGVRHLLNVHAPLAWEGARYRQQPLEAAAGLLEEAAFSFASQIVTNTRELRHDLIAVGVDAAKVKVVPNGVDVDLFAPEGPTRRHAPEGAVVLGFVGSLKAWHGVDVLAETFRRLAPDPRFHLVVVGDGPMANVLRNLREEFAGRITLVGAVPQGEVPAHIRAMDIAVTPYPLLERFYYSPLKVLEYMAAGRAIVASRIGQIVELIRDGETGLLVPPGDPQALADAIQTLASDLDLRRRLGTAAVAEVRSAHTWTQRAAEIVGLAEAMR